jgi:predicted nucleotidyltransferase component of viral defense system
MKTGNNFSSHITVDKVLRKLKRFSEDVELSITADKTDERDRSVRNGVNTWQSELWVGEDRGIALLVDEL